MKIDTEEIANLLGNRSITAYSIERDAGVSRAVISKIRAGQKEMKRLSLETLIKLQGYIDKKKTKK